MEKFEAPKQLSPEEMAEIEKEKNIEAIQTEEKSFLSKIKESARDAFHFAPKESFKKIMRTVVLATVLLAPVGEKAFAERAEVSKEQTVAMAQMNQESDQLEQEDDSESLDPVTEQKELIKEKYNVDIIGDNSEYTPEELQDFEDALDKVQKFAPEKFGELKLVLVKANNPLFDMKVCRNLCKELDTIENIKSNNEGFDLLITLLELEKDNKDKIDKGYDVVMIGSNKEELEKDREDDEEWKIKLLKIGKKKDFTYIATAGAISGIHQKDVYKNIFIHELSHLMTLNDFSLYEELSNKFKEINKKIGNSEIINHSIHSKSNLDRYQGFVSAYAGVGGQGGLMFGYPDEYEYNESNTVSEDVAETVTYMINDYHYADDDPIVQEKIKVLEEFLNEKSND